jgi:exopolysaccharide production protein ExoQ
MMHSIQEGIGATGPAVAFTGGSGRSGGINRVDSTVFRAPTTGDRGIEGTLDWLRCRAETSFVVVALFLFTDALLPVLLAETRDEVRFDDGSPLLRWVFITLQLISVMIVVPRWRSFVRTAIRHKSTLLLLAMVVGSVAWSIEAGITLRRGIALLGTTVFGFYLASRYSTLSLLHRLAAALGLVLLLSIVFAVALPGIGVHADAHAGAWRGVLPHKNALGQTSTLAVLVFYIVWKGSDRYRGAGFVGILLAIPVLLLSRSATALVLVALLGATWPLYSMLRWRVGIMVPALIVTMLVGGGAVSLLLAHREAALHALGRDPTLTGRTDMWGIIWQAIASEPWLGYGYRSFWRDDESGRLAIWAALEWTPTTAHNGIVDLALDIGLLGVAIFLTSFVSAVYLAFRAVRTHRHPVSFWPLMFLTFLLLCNITESMLLQANNILWILYVAVVSSMLLHDRRPDASTIAAGVGAAVSGPTPQLGPALHAPLSPAIRRRLSFGSPSPLVRPP